MSLKSDPRSLFLAALITGAVGLLGVKMLLGGMARARRRRLALAESRGASQDLQTDRDRLAAESLAVDDQLGDELGGEALPCCRAFHARVGAGPTLSFNSCRNFAT